MATTLTIAVAEDAGAPIVFAERCVGCGEVATTQSNLSFAKVTTNARGTQAPVHVKLPVPHCQACASRTKRVFLAALVPFVLGFLVVGGAAFVLVAFKAATAGLDEVGRPNNANSLIVGAAAGLAAGLVGAFVAELIARVLLLPVLGSALWQAPLFVPSLLTDVDHVAGLTGRPNGDLTAITVTFAHDDIAQAFARSNVSRVTAG